jgi:PAS domain S-box-containing protein
MAPSQTPPQPALPLPLGDDAHSVVAGGLVDQLLERMTDGFLALDREWRVVYMNSAAMGLNARPRPDVIGRLHWEEWPQTVGSEVERQYRLAMATQRAVHFEHHYDQDGQDFWHSIHAYPDANGLSIFYRDITEQKRLALANAQLLVAERAARHEAEEAQRRAEDANQSKAQFLRAMSHEFRTPLNAIGGYTQLLLLGLRGELTPTQRSDVERIERNLLHVTTLINDVVSFTRLEAGRVEFELARFAVRELLDELESFVAPQAGARTVAIGAVPGDLRIYADRAKTTQILVNLLTNAFRHTPATAAVEISCGGGLDAPVWITVRDEGPGIPPEQHQSIFEPFVQLGRELKHPMEGLGLGLAIARDLARGMNGELALESTPGQGCVFTLRLPPG